MCSVKSSNRSLSRASLIGLAALIGAGPAMAQSDSARIRDLERRLEQSIKLIEDLST